MCVCVSEREREREEGGVTSQHSMFNIIEREHMPPNRVCSLGPELVQFQDRGWQGMAPGQAMHCEGIVYVWMGLGKDKQGQREGLWGGGSGRGVAMGRCEWQEVWQWGGGSGRRCGNGEVGVAGVWLRDVMVLFSCTNRTSMV